MIGIVWHICRWLLLLDLCWWGDRAYILDFHIFGFLSCLFSKINTLFLTTVFPIDGVFFTARTISVLPMMIVRPGSFSLMIFRKVLMSWNWNNGKVRVSLSSGIFQCLAVLLLFFLLIWALHCVWSPQSSFPFQFIFSISIFLFHFNSSFSFQFSFSISIFCCCCWVPPYCPYRLGKRDWMESTSGMEPLWSEVTFVILCFVVAFKLNLVLIV